MADDAKPHRDDYRDTVFLPDTPFPMPVAAFDGVDPAEVFRTSSTELKSGEGPSDGFRIPESPGAAVLPPRARGCRCALCWRVLSEVTVEGGLCLRCGEASGSNG
jgi:hypothetical protein